MANTGIEIINTQIQVDTITGPTGITRANVTSLGTAYMPPAPNYTKCPVVFNTDCPVVIATAGNDVLTYEFSLENAQVLNSSVKAVRVQAMSGTTAVATDSFTLPNPTPNYFSGSLSLAAGTYTIRVSFMDAVTNGNSLKDCEDKTKTYTVT